MRKKIVAGNWKMMGSRTTTDALVLDILPTAQSLVSSQLDIILFPSFVYLQSIESLLKGSEIALGAQNLSPEKQGAFTGEISGGMLRDLGCQYVLVGHSERRALFHENLVVCAAKFKAALDSQLVPILCIGETQQEREENKTESVLTAQIESVIDLFGIHSFANAVVAYEPVWAIGTGLTATPEEAQRTHAFIRQKIAKYNIDIANSLRILYGGSVKADNAAGLFEMPDIDGGLVGGASLDAKSFLEICKAAKNVNLRT